MKVICFFLILYFGFIDMAVKTAFKNAAGLAQALEQKLNHNLMLDRQVFPDWVPGKKFEYLAMPQGKVFTTAGISVAASVGVADVMCHYWEADKKWHCWPVEGFAGSSVRIWSKYQPAAINEEERKERFEVSPLGTYWKAEQPDLIYTLDEEEEDCFLVMINGGSLLGSCVCVGYEVTKPSTEYLITILKNGGNVIIFNEWLKCGAGTRAELNSLLAELGSSMVFNNTESGQVTGQILGYVFSASTSISGGTVVDSFDGAALIAKQKLHGGFVYTIGDTNISIDVCGLGPLPQANIDFWNEIAGVF